MWPSGEQVVNEYFWQCFFFFPEGLFLLRLHFREWTKVARLETLVFQCVGCRRIAGDSYAWCGAYAELNAVSLQVEGPDVEVGTELLTSSEFDCEPFAVRRQRGRAGV